MMHILHLLLERAAYTLIHPEYLRLMIPDSFNHKRTLFELGNLSNRGIQTVRQISSKHYNIAINHHRIKRSFSS